MYLYTTITKTWGLNLMVARGHHSSAKLCGSVIMFFWDLLCAISESFVLSYSQKYICMIKVLKKKMLSLTFPQNHVIERALNQVRIL